MKPANISAMIFTLNEELHLPSCLKSVEWCDDVIVVDSFSTDRTKEICQQAGVRFYEHAFEGFGVQRNWAIDNTNPKYDWILILDADERVTPELAAEIGRTIAATPDTVGACRLKRRFFMWEKWLKYSSLYPTWVVRLIHKDRVRYINRGHAETQEVKGEIRELAHDLIDENLKGIDEWHERQDRYSTKDAEYELSQEKLPFSIGRLFSADPLERRAAMKRLATALPGRGLWYFLYSYVFRRGFLDGREGLHFCIMKARYQQMVNMKKLNMRRQEKS